MNTIPPLDWAAEDTGVSGLTVTLVDADPATDPGDFVLTIDTGTPTVLTIARDDVVTLWFGLKDIFDPSTKESISPSSS